MKAKGLYREFFLFHDVTIMIGIFILVAGYVVLSGPSWLHAVYFAGGLVAYMFSEYLTHRFVFHLKAPKNPTLLKFLKRIHYDHHTDPNDLKLLFLPIWYSLPNIGAAAVIFYLFFESTLIGTLSFASGLIFMLLVYEWKHYIAHRPIKPKTKFGIWVKKLHMLHHYKNENYWYGVSTPFVDVLFGTLKDEKQVETSPTAKSLENR